MTLRSPHGNAARLSPAPRVEVLPPDEQPHGVPAPLPEASGPERDAQGRFLPGHRATSAQGGRARGARVRATRHLERVLDAGGTTPELAAEVVACAAAHAADLAAHVGGGKLTHQVHTLVQLCALQTVASRVLFARALGEDVDSEALASASRMANDARQAALAAHELAAREAQGRRERGELPPLWTGNGTTTPKAPRSAQEGREGYAATSGHPSGEEDER